MRRVLVATAIACVSSVDAAATLSPAADPTERAALSADDMFKRLQAESTSAGVAAASAASDANWAMEREQMGLKGLGATEEEVAQLHTAANKARIAAIMAHSEAQIASEMVQTIAAKHEGRLQAAAEGVSGVKDTRMDSGWPHRNADLFNPSIIHINGSAADGDEQMLVAMRRQMRNKLPNCLHCAVDVQWYKSNVALGWVSHSEGRISKLAHPQELSSSDLFGAELPFECAQSYGGATNFGEEDPRLLHLDGLLYLLVETRARFASPGVSCKNIGEQQDTDPLSPSYTVTRQQGLQPYLIPIYVDADGEVRANKAKIVQLHLVGKGDKGKSQQIEKNWSPFYDEESGQTLAIYSVHPHVLLDVNTSTGAATVAHTSTSDEVKRALSLSYNASYGKDESGAKIAPESHRVSDVIDGFALHGGAGVARIGGGSKDAYYLSAMHYRTQWDYQYRTHLYKFRAEPPYDVLAVSRVALPLQSAASDWGGQVAFPVSLLVHHDSEKRASLWISYGTGDFESRLFTTPLDTLDATFFDGGLQGFGKGYSYPFESVVGGAGKPAARSPPSAEAAGNDRQ